MHNPEEFNNLAIVKNGRTIFIPELNTFGTAFDVVLTVNGKDGEDGFEDWIKTLDLDTLERLMKTQVESENFISADILHKEIKTRKK